MRSKVRVILWGLGAMGSGIARMLLSKKGFTITGVLEIDPTKVGKRLYEVLEMEPTADNQTVISNKPEKIIKKNAAEIAIISTSSLVKQVFPLIKMIVNAGIHVITTAEEMAYPKAANPDLTAEIDSLAKTNNVTILGTGINPGFIMDYLVIALTGVCEEITSLKISQINNLAPFGKKVMKEQGIGLKPEEFYNRVKDRTIEGHVGFLQSFGMFEEALQIKLNNIEQKKEPIVTNVPRTTKLVSVKPGEVVGCKQQGFGYKNDHLFIKMEHPQQINPEAENIETGDYILFEGVPNITLQIKPEIPGGIGTIALGVNMIPHVLNASPGLKTMLDLPVPRAILGDVRELIIK